MLKELWNEADLIKRAQQGEEKAFGQLLLHYEKYVQDYISPFYEHDSGLLEDACQEIWITVWTSLSEYDEDKSSFKTWLTEIAKTRSQNVVRDDERQCPKHFKKDEEDVSWIEIPIQEEDLSSLLPEDLPDEASDPARQLETRQLLDIALDVIDKLPDNDRQLAQLRFIDSASYEEISNEMDVNIPAAKKRVERLRKKLRRQIEERVR